MPYPYRQNKHDKAAEIGCLVCVIACTAIVGTLLMMIFAGMILGEIHY